MCILFCVQWQWCICTIFSGIFFPVYSLALPPPPPPTPSPPNPYCPQMCVYMWIHWGLVSATYSLLLALEARFECVNYHACFKRQASVRWLLLKCFCVYSFHYRCWFKLQFTVSWWLKENKNKKLLCRKRTACICIRCTQGNRMQSKLIFFKRTVKQLCLEKKAWLLICPMYSVNEVFICSAFDKVADRIVVMKIARFWAFGLWILL